MAWTMPLRRNVIMADYREALDLALAITSGNPAAIGLSVVPEIPEDAAKYTGEQLFIGDNLFFVRENGEIQRMFVWEACGDRKTGEICTGLISCYANCSKAQ